MNPIEIITNNNDIYLQKRKLYIIIIIQATLLRSVLTLLSRLKFFWILVIYVIIQNFYNCLL